MTRTFQRDDSPAAPSLPLITFSDFCCSSVSARRPRPVSGRRTVTQRETESPARPKTNRRQRLISAGVVVLRLSGAQDLGFTGGRPKKFTQTIKYADV